MVATMPQQPRTADQLGQGLPDDRFFHPACAAFQINHDCFQPDFEAGDVVIFETIRNPKISDLVIGRFYLVRTPDDGKVESIQAIGRLRRRAGEHFWLECAVRGNEVTRVPFALNDLKQFAVAVQRQIDLLNKKAGATAREDAPMLSRRGIDVGEEVTGPSAEG